MLDVPTWGHDFVEPPVTPTPPTGTGNPTPPIDPTPPSNPTPPSDPTPPSAPATDEIHTLEADGADAFERGHYMRARRAYTRLTELAPNEPRYWRRLGETHEKRDEARSAITAYRRYLELVPDAPDGNRIRTKVQALRAPR